MNVQAKVTNQKEKKAPRKTDFAKKLNNATREAHYKPKIEQTKYVKTFDTFSAGVDAMVGSSPAIDELLSNNGLVFDGKLGFTVDNAMQAMLNIFTKNMPSFSERKNIHYDLSISANKCSIKTDKFVSFGWYIKTNWKDGVPESSYIFHVIIFGENEDLVNSLLDTGWEEEVYKK
jgi:hypothetical protein